MLGASTARGETRMGAGCGDDCCGPHGRGFTIKPLWISLWINGVWVGGVAWAQLPQIDNYSGDLWSRPALTGDWGGWRNTLAKKGINLDVDLVQDVQGLNAGGSFRNRDSVRYPYGSHAQMVRKVLASSVGWALAIGTPTSSSSSTASASAARACSPGGIWTASASASTTPTSATTCRRSSCRATRSAWKSSTTSRRLTGSL